MVGVGGGGGGRNGGLRKRNLRGGGGGGGRARRGTRGGEGAVSVKDSHVVRWPRSTPAHSSVSSSNKK